MRKILLGGVLLALLSITFAGCEKWFDISPKTEIKATDLFESEEGFWEALTGVYLKMSDRKAYGGYLSWEVVEFMAWQHEVGGTNKWRGLQRQEYSTDGSQEFIDKSWLQLYNIIAEANYLLFALDEYGSHLSEPVYRNIKAQAIAVRAYCHFDLMRLFAQGNLAAKTDAERAEILARPCIPYVDKYGAAATPQREYGWTLDRAMKDVTDAIALFDDSDIAEIDRVQKLSSNMNIHAARILAARIELWRGNYEAALPYADKAMADLTQAARWGQQTYQSGIMKSELVFFVSVFNLFSWQDSEKWWGLTTSQRLISVGQKGVSANIFMINPAVENFSVIISDIRYANWYRFDNQSGADESRHGHVSVKVECSENSTNNVVGLIRMSEAWLIAAECELANGTPEGRTRAIDHVNTVRRYRGNPEGYQVHEETVSDEDLKQIIMLEQLREVSQEGQAFFMYKRLGTVRMVNAPKDMTDELYVLPYPQGEQAVGHNN